MGRKNKKTLVLLDGNNTFYRSVAVMSLTNSSGHNISGIYGTLQSVRYILSSFNPDRFILCWDSGKSVHRTRLYPEYKKRAKKGTIGKSAIDYKTVHKHMKVTAQLLRYTGVTQCKRKGIEADDAICFLSGMKKYGRVIIVSTDKDFYQLIDGRVSVYNPITNVLWTIHNFATFDNLGFTPAQYLDYHIIQGDKSDNVSGIRHVGKKTSQNLISQYGDCRKAYVGVSKKIKSIFDSYDFREVAFYNNYNTCKRNAKLIDLQYYRDNFMSKSDIKLIKGKYDLNNFRKLVQLPSLGFMSIVQDFDYWILPFRRLYTVERRKRAISARKG